LKRRYSDGKIPDRPAGQCAGLIMNKGDTSDTLINAGSYTVAAS
jgi:hypothetical protein